MDTDSINKLEILSIRRETLNWTWKLVIIIIITVLWMYILPKNLKRYPWICIKSKFTYKSTKKGCGKVL